MTFDIAKFEQKQYKDRTADIPVPELAEFFGEDETPVWTVKCLTASEIAISTEAVANNRNIDGLIGALAAGGSKEKIEAIKETLGLPTDKTPNDLVKRFSTLVSGSVSPECPQNIAVKLAVNFPVTFYNLTNKILELTGQGRLGE